MCKQQKYAITDIGQSIIFGFVKHQNVLIIKVREWWPSYQLLGTPNFFLPVKLKALKKLNEEVLGNIVDQKKSLFEELHNHDEKGVVGNLSTIEKEKKLGVASKLQKITLMEGGRFHSIKSPRLFG